MFPAQHSSSYCYYCVPHARHALLLIISGPLPPAGTVFRLGSYKAPGRMLPITRITPVSHMIQHTQYVVLPGLPGYGRLSVALYVCQVPPRVRFLCFYVGMDCPALLHSLAAWDPSSVLPITRFRC